MSELIAPHDSKLEAALLGAALIAPDVLAEIDLPAEAFFIVRHQWIWEAMKRIHARGENVDPLTLEAELRALKRFDQVGGVSYLARLAATPASSLNAPDYAARVAELWKRRRYLQHAERVAKAAYDPEADPAREAEAMLEIASDGRGAAQAVHVSIAVQDAIAAAHHAAEHPDDASVVVWGLPKVDRMLFVERDTMVVLAARPGEGKSSLALTAALRSARAGRRVLFVSLEMSVRELGQRVSAQVANIPIPKIQRGMLDGGEWERLHEAPGKLARLPLEILSMSGATPAAILAAAERFKARHGGIDILVVDYLGLVSVTGQRQYERVTQASIALRQIIKRLDVVGLVVHQLSRGVVYRGGRPRLDDLRDSGQVEQDAGVVMFIYRPDEWGDPEPGAPMVASCLYVAKVRQGVAGWQVQILRRSHTTEIVESSEDCPKGGE